LVCKDTGRTIAVGDRVRARVVALSLNEREPRESKIGLTMRQPGLGTLAWIEDERNREKAEKERK
ncbi:MAG TPA: DNA-directed RNA polymerase, partial [Methanocorpusculum sp.]|nr:DNA-directed RNA polymerase [Methanocorpusculum sp.]